MTTSEGNKIIAEFMGYKPDTTGRYHSMLPTAYLYEGSNYQMQTTFTPKSMKYKTSWAWLMPVVDRIENLGYGVSIGMGDYCVIQDDVTSDGIEFTGMAERKIQSVYDAVVEFIKWYNENKKV
jgi:hypothetical protein